MFPVSIEKAGRHLPTREMPFECIRKSLSQFENQIMARVCKEHSSRTMHQKAIVLARTDVWKISSVACEFSSIKIFIEKT